MYIALDGICKYTVKYVKFVAFAAPVHLFVRTFIKMYFFLRQFVFIALGFRNLFLCVFK